MDSAIAVKPAGISGQPEQDRLLSLLTKGLVELVDQYHLKRDAVTQHESRIRDLLLNSIHGEPAELDENNPRWGWQPALASPDLSVGTLTVWRDSDIPLHDHPGSTGLLLVLEGKVRVRSYRLTDDLDSGNAPLELELTADKTIGAGELWQFGPYQHNIHSLQSVDGDCRIFDVLFSPYQLQQRSFFMPIIPGNDARNIFATRLNRLHRRSLH